MRNKPAPPLDFTEDRFCESRLVIEKFVGCFLSKLAEIYLEAKRATPVSFTSMRQSQG